MSHTEVLRYTAFSDGAKMKKREGWRLIRPESGSAILVFTCPLDYCTWQSLPPIAFRYLRRLSNFPVRLSLLEKGIDYEPFAFYWMFMVVCCLYMFLKRRGMEIEKQEVNYYFNE